MSAITLKAFQGAYKRAEEIARSHQGHFFKRDFRHGKNCARCDMRRAGDDRDMPWCTNYSIEPYLISALRFDGLLEEDYAVVAKKRLIADADERRRAMAEAQDREEVLRSDAEADEADALPPPRYNDDRLRLYEIGTASEVAQEWLERL